MRSIGKFAYSLCNSLYCFLLGVEKLILPSFSLFKIVGLFSFFLIFSGALGAESTINHRAMGAAYDLLKKQKWGEAVVAYQALYQSHPGHLTIAIDLATAHVFSGNRLEGLSLLVDFWSHASKDEQREVESKFKLLSRFFLTNRSFDLYQDALNLLEARKYSQARVQLSQVLSVEPDHLDAILKLAQCLILEQRPQQAMDELSKVKRWSFFEPEISLWLGRAYFMNANYPQFASKALFELKYAHSKMKGSEVLVIWLAQVYLKLGQSQQAISLLERDISAYPLHIVSLLKAAQIKVQFSKGDSTSLWAARRDLQLAMSRFEKDQYSSVIDIYELVYGVRKKPKEVKGEIQELLQQVQTQLEELGTRHE